MSFRFDNVPVYQNGMFNTNNNNQYSDFSYPQQNATQNLTSNLNRTQNVQSNSNIFDLVNLKDYDSDSDEEMEDNSFVMKSLKKRNREYDTDTSEFDFIDSKNLEPTRKKTKMNGNFNRNLQKMIMQFERLTTERIISIILDDDREQQKDLFPDIMYHYDQMVV